MTNEKILEVIDFLETDCNLRWPNIKPREMKWLALQGLTKEHVAHIKSMFPRLRELVAESQREQAFLWLGFIQGWFWAGGAFSVEELGRMNKPTEEA